MTPSPSITKQRGFIILHGWQNHRPEDHWQFWLAGRLEHLGFDVRYPQLPSPDEPIMKDWVTAIVDELDATDGMSTTVVCHSLACVAWMHLAESGILHTPVDQLLFVAPPSPAFLESQHELANFALDGHEPPLVAGTVVNPLRMVCSENDTFCAEGAVQVFPDFTDVDLLPGAGHFDMEAGYEDWPGVLDWCLDSRARVSARPR